MADGVGVGAGPLAAAAVAVDGAAALHLAASVAADRLDALVVAAGRHDERALRDGAAAPGLRRHVGDGATRGVEAGHVLHAAAHDVAAPAAAALAALTADPAAPSLATGAAQTGLRPHVALHAVGVARVVVALSAAARQAAAFRHDGAAAALVVLGVVGDVTAAGGLAAGARVHQPVTAERVAGADRHVAAPDPCAQQYTCCYISSESTR